MYCKNCGKELQDDWKQCPECGTIVENVRKSTSVIESPSSKKKGKKPIFKRIWFWLLIVLVVFVIIILISGGGDKDAEWGKPVTVDGVISLTVNKGGFYDKIYPFNSVDKSTGIQYRGDGVMFGLYGVIENLSQQRIDVNEVCQAKLILDDKYESNVTIWLENEEETVFTGYNELSDQIYLSPDAYMNPKDKFPCVLMGQAGTQVYEDTKTAVLELKILKNVDEADNYVTYKMPLSFTEKETENDFTDIELTQSAEPETTKEETTSAPQTTEAATSAPQTTEADVKKPKSDMQYLKYESYKSSIGNGYSFGENSEDGFQILNGDEIEIGVVYIYAGGADMPDDYLYYDEVEQGSFDDYHWYTAYNTGNGHYLWVIEAHDMAVTNALLYLDTAYADKIEKSGFTLELH